MGKLVGKIHNHGVTERNLGWENHVIVDVASFEKLVEAGIAVRANLICDECVIAVSRGTYQELVRKADILDALVACGVHKWDGWDNAHEMLDNQPEEVTDEDNTKQ